MSAGTLLIRADGGISIGTGHVMRCLALAQAWQDAGGKAVFAIAEATPSMERRLQVEGVRVERIAAPAGSEADATSTAAYGKLLMAHWVVIDGYHFNGDYQLALKNLGCKVLAVDDNGHAEHYYADLVLNQNAHAEEAAYNNREPYTELLLGPRYAMLRREFAAWCGWKREIRSLGTRVLIVSGGSDPGNLIEPVVAALDEVQRFKLELLVVAGGSIPHLREIENRLARSRHQLRLVKDAGNMAELMSWADMAISAAGSICWEFCALALPALLIPVAENQLRSARNLQRLGVADLLCDGIFSTKEVPAGKIAQAAEQLIASQPSRQALSQRSHVLVDGGGASRVVAALFCPPWRREVG